MEKIGIIALAIIATLYAAAAIVSGWGWFIVPLGLPAIGYAHALGLVSLAGLFKSPPNFADKSSSELMVTAFVRISVAFGLMWIYSQFM